MFAVLSSRPFTTGGNLIDAPKGLDHPDPLILKVDAVPCQTDEFAISHSSGNPCGEHREIPRFVLSQVSQDDVDFRLRENLSGNRTRRDFDPVPPKSDVLRLNTPHGAQNP